MKKFAMLVAFAAVASAPVVAFADTVPAVTLAASGQGGGAATAVSLSAGKMLYAADGNKVAPVYRVSTAGDAQIILNGRLVTVPAASLTDAGGKVTTSLSRKELASTK